MNLVMVFASHVNADDLLQYQFSFDWFFFVTLLINSAFDVGMRQCKSLNFRNQIL